MDYLAGNVQLVIAIFVLYLYNIIYKNNANTQEKGRAATRPFVIL